MTEDVRSRCLEPFFSTKGESGTGLGLSMVFGIIKRHEGQVEIDSTLGQGTTFRLRLPAMGAASDGAPAAAAALIRPLRVLVVDDDAVSRAVVENYLIKDGHLVTTAPNGWEASNRLERMVFDLLIADHAMPGMNGVELARIARNVRASFPVILMTGFAAGAPGPSEEPPGVSLVLRKPVSQRQLRTGLVKVMGGEPAATHFHPALA